MSLTIKKLAEPRQGTRPYGLEISFRGVVIETLYYPSIEHRDVAAYELGTKYVRELVSLLTQITDKPDKPVPYKSGKDAAEEVVGHITKYVNSCSTDPQHFITAMTHEHRTLQQSFTRLCVAWLMVVGQDEYLTDMRNEATHQVGNGFNRAIAAGIIDPHLPLI